MRSSSCEFVPRVTCSKKVGSLQKRNQNKPLGENKQYSCLQLSILPTSTHSSYKLVIISQITMATPLASTDIPLLITSDNASSERRVSPSWTLSQFKGRLEPITGIPAVAQRLTLKVASQTPQPIAATDEDTTLLAQWPLQQYAEILVGHKSFHISY